MAKIRYSVAYSPSTWSVVGILSATLLLYIGTFLSPSSALNTKVLVTRGDSLHPSKETFANLTKRVDDALYAKAQDLGNKLVCYFPMTMAQARAAAGKPVEAASYLQTDVLSVEEGWKPFKGGMENSQLLTEAFSGLSITGTLIPKGWTQEVGGRIVADPFNPVAEGAESGILTGAEFLSAFVPADGVIIADNNLSVNARMTKIYGTTWKTKGLPVTHIQQWSDAVWLQWRQVCTDTNSDFTNVRFIIRKWIINSDTLGIVLQAMLNAKGKDRVTGVQNPVTVGNTWADRVTLTAAANPNEFAAILGSPNGSGAGWFLITHKGSLGSKAITRVDIYAGLDEFTVEDSDEDTVDTIENEQVMLVFTVE